MTDFKVGDIVRVKPNRFSAAKGDSLENVNMNGAVWRVMGVGHKGFPSLVILELLFGPLPPRTVKVLNESHLERIEDV
jgi:hypothetical protein